MRVLVLCSGTGSVDRAFERKGWEVVSIDWLAKFRPTIRVDIMKWDYRAAFPKDHFAFVWASPACTHFSIARTTGGPRDIEGATALVARCLEIAEHFGCDWCMENPATGLLKRQPLMQGLLWTDTCYCKYGFEYRKQTRLWHSLPFGEAFQPKPICCKSSPCPSFAAKGMHPKSAQHGADRVKGGGRKQNDDCSQAQLYSMPPALCDEIAQAAGIVYAMKQRHGRDPEPTQGSQDQAELRTDSGPK